MTDPEINDNTIVSQPIKELAYFISDRPNVEKIRCAYLSDLKYSDNVVSERRTIEVDNITGEKIYSRIFKLKDSEPKYTVFFLPATGFTTNHPEISERLASIICETYGWRIVVLWYRNGPENKSSVNDVAIAVNHFLQYSGIVTEKIAFFGYSSGGNTALNLPLHDIRCKTKIADRLPITQLILFAPAVDHEAMQSDSISEFYRERSKAALSKQIKPNGVEYSPLHNRPEHIGQLCPITMFYGKNDDLYSGINDFKTIAENNGVNIEGIIEPDMPHFAVWGRISEILSRPSVKARLQTLFEQGPSLPKIAIPKFDLIYSYVRHGETPCFEPATHVVRQNIQLQLSRTLTRQRSGARICANLHGPSGAGKTQEALAFFFSDVARSNFQYLFWCDASNEFSIKILYSQFAREVRVDIPGATMEQNANTFIQWLRTTNAEYLLVLDNILLSKDKINHYLAKDRGHLLITSPTNILELDISELIEVNQLNAEETVQLANQTLNQPAQVNLFTDLIDGDYSGLTIAPLTALGYIQLFTNTALRNGYNTLVRWHNYIFRGLPLGDPKLIATSASGILASPYLTPALLTLTAIALSYSIYRHYADRHTAEDLHSLTFNFPLVTSHLASCIRHSDMSIDDFKTRLNDSASTLGSEMCYAITIIIINLELFANNHPDIFDEMCYCLPLNCTNIPTTLIFPENKLTARNLLIEYNIIDNYSHDAATFTLHNLTKTALQALAIQREQISAQAIPNIENMLIRICDYLNDNPKQNRQAQLIPHLESMLEYVGPESPHTENIKSILDNLLQQAARPNYSPTLFNNRVNRPPSETTDQTTTTLTALSTATVG